MAHGPELDESSCVVVLDKIRCRSGIQKYVHFSAADRSQRLRDWLSVPVVVINLVLGSTFFVFVGREMPPEAKWIGAIAALVAAVLGGIQTYFNLKKANDLHRSVANRYLAISRECEVLIAQHRDGLVDLHKVSERLLPINSEYQKVSKDAESVPTTSADYILGKEKFSAEESFC